MLLCFSYLFVLFGQARLWNPQARAVSLNDLDFLLLALILGITREPT